MIAARERPDVPLEVRKKFDDDGVRGLRNEIALSDFQLGDYFLPAKTTLLMSQFVTHRDPRFFPDPLRFDPERFTPEREKQLPRYAFVPFGAGPRICIGMYFAMMEGHLLLATLAQRVSFSLVTGQTIVPDPVHHLTLRPAGEVQVLVKRR